MVRGDVASYVSTTRSFLRVLFVLCVLCPVGGIVADVIADGGDGSVSAENVIVEARLPDRLRQSRLAASLGHPSFVGANYGG